MRELFLFYRRSPICYASYKEILFFLNHDEKKHFLDFVTMYNAILNEMDCIVHKKYLDSVMGEGIILERDQRKAIVSSASALLIIAGAGSGKTTTLLAKIKYLIEVKKVSASSIGIISYTNETVRELKEKLYKQYPVSVFTFHTFALSLFPHHKKILSDSKPILKLCLIHLLSVPHFRKKAALLFGNLLEESSIFLYFLPIEKYQKWMRNSMRKGWNKLILYLETVIQKIEVEGIDKSKSLFQNEEIFFVIIQIYSEYQKYLQENKLIDFEGIIIETSEKLHRGEMVQTPFSYLLVDEYQDISFNRFNLLYEYVTKIHCNLCVVGDDFQSIYAFSGSKVTLFTEFTSYFKESEVYTIHHTYRNSQALIDVAGSFVMKNPLQVPKKLFSTKKEPYPIWIWYYKNHKFSTFLKCLENISETDTVLLLGRYHFDVEFIIQSSDFEKKGNSILYLKNPKLSITFLTVHASKGLGFDSVILLNMERGYYGFPSEKKSVIEEKYLFAEERRLFYVALTRTKKKVHLLVPFRNASSFVCEILESHPSLIWCIDS